MIRTNTTDAIATTATILFILALIGSPTDSSTVWIVRTLSVYPFTHLAWRAYRHRQHR